MLAAVPFGLSMEIVVATCLIVTAIMQMMIFVTIPQNMELKPVDIAVYPFAAVLKDVAL